MSSSLSGILSVNGPLTSSSEIVCSAMTGSDEVAVSFAQVSLSSLPSGLRPFASWKAPIAFSTFSPPRPSITPGEKRARSSSTCAFRVTGLILLPPLAGSSASLTSWTVSVSARAGAAPRRVAIVKAIRAAAVCIENLLLSISGLREPARRSKRERHQGSPGRPPLLADAEPAIAATEVEVIGVSRIGAWPEHGGEVGAGPGLDLGLEAVAGGFARERHDRVRLAPV